MIRLPKVIVGTLALALLLGLAMPVLAAEEAKGTLKSVNTERGLVVLKGVLQDTTYIMKKDPFIVLDGRKVKLADLRDGDRVVITYEKSGNDMIGSDVRALRSASETTSTIRHILTDKNQILMRGLVKDTTYNLEKDLTVYINFKGHNLSDLREGDECTLTYVQRGDQLFVSEIRCYRK